MVPAHAAIAADQNMLPLHCPSVCSFQTASGKQVSGYLQYKSSKHLACCKEGDGGTGEPVCTPPTGGSNCSGLLTCIGCPLHVKRLYFGEH